MTTSPPAGTPVAVAHCTLKQLAVTEADGGPAAGTEGTYLRFTNHGSVCTVHGWPSVVGVASGTTSSPARDVMQALNTPTMAQVPTITLASGASAVAALTAAANPGPSGVCGPAFTHLRVGIPGDPRVDLIAATIPGYSNTIPHCARLAVTFLLPASAVAHESPNP